LSKFNTRRGAGFTFGTPILADQFSPDFASPPSDFIWTNFNGTSGDDIFTGGSENDTAAGNGGNDQLSGGGGHDVIGGGAGADVVNGDDGSDQLYSFDISPPFNRPYYGNPWTPPVLDIGAEFDMLSGGAGGDTLFAGYGDTVDGGADSDVLYISFLGASAGVTADFRQLYNNGSMVIGGGTLSNIEAIGWIEGSNFDDVLTDMDSSSNFAPMFGNGGNDRLYGGYYTGDIHGGDGDDLIDRGNSPYGFQHYGEAGNDLLIGSYNGERLDGGSGNDELRGHGGFDDLFGGDGDDLMDGGSYGDTLAGDAGNDVMYGGGDADTMDGGSGDDVMHGDFSPISMGNALSPSSNDERMWGGLGADVIHGNAGNDTIWSGERDGQFGFQGKDDAGLERDQLFGDEGNDTLAIGYGDDADGGIGSDSLRISLAGAASGVTLSTSGFVPGGVWSINGGTVQNVEILTAVVGSAFGDTITVATHAFGLNLDGGAGNDLITSNGSSVFALGGAGDDRLVSGAAGDTFDGGAGVDTIDYSAYGSAVTVSLGLAAGSTGTGAGGDQLINVENVEGSGFGDTIAGSDQANLLRGNGGDDSLRGNGGDDVLIGGAGNDMMNGGSGNDSFFVDSAGDTVVEAAGGGFDIVYVGFSYILSAGTSVEVLAALDNTATTAINLTGNELDNYLAANAGANTLDGGGGADQLWGRGGNDSYYVDGNDAVVEYAGDGYDIVYARNSYALGVGMAVEVLATIDNTATTAINLAGNALDNYITGNAGANTLDGGGGSDTLWGREGDDSYFADMNDVVLEYAGQGNDILYASANYALAAGLSIEVLATANNLAATAINLTGNELDNFVIGNAGANLLDGGTGADQLWGRGGDDSYYVDGNDAVVEYAGDGNDIVYARTSYALGVGMAVEVLATIDNTATTAINLIGNAFNNYVVGNAGANTLDGGGGSDILWGREGDDSYFADGNDTVIEAAGQGNDILYAGSDYTLAAGLSIEVLATADNTATTALRLTGNELDNYLIGNAGANILDGGGGSDILWGREGDDSYFVDGNDVVVEYAGQGSDVVHARSSFALAAGMAIEELRTADENATTAIDLTGNELVNLIRGNAGNNVINGGLGNDGLAGNGGADSFLFNTALGPNNHDFFLDFVSGTDKILLDHRIFTGLALGELSPDVFNGGGNNDGNDRIIFNGQGFLFFDADGNGPGDAILFAVLQPGGVVTASDFVVI